MRIINKDFNYRLRLGADGSKEESDRWLGSLVDKHIYEHISILDYGCGYGRLSNYLSEKLNNFSYFGLEPNYAGGPQHIGDALKYFNDPRNRFGFIGTELEQEALEKCNLIVLGSVFTHLNYNTIKLILSKFKPIANDNVNIIASIFFDKEYSLGPSYNDYPDIKYFYEYVFYKEDMIRKICDFYTINEWIGSDTRYKHNIVCINKIKNNIRIKR